MKESYFFKPVKEDIEKKKAMETKLLTAGEHEETEQKTMTLKDHWLSLRQSIQDKLTIEKPTAEEQEKTKLLSELITPKLMAEYKQILKSFNDKTKKSEEHSQREFIDINYKELSDNIESWIENLVDEVKSKKETGLDENDTEELRAQCWLLFDSVGSVMNTKSLEKDIADFYKDKTPDESDEKEQEKQKSELVKDLQSRYPLDKIEVEILVDLVKSTKSENENYSPKILVETISRLWSEYKLGEKKGTIAKISLGYLLSKGVESFAPSLFQNIMAQDKFNVAVFLEY
ncbi:MAG: hypothetical protein COZ27_00765, partial [Candidatus Moranbacteria bacterium CG_4_10_14_3_um_filter_41_65]